MSLGLTSAYLHVLRDTACYNDLGRRTLSKGRIGNKEKSQHGFEFGGEAVMTRKKVIAG